jgi:hypothetical protein
MQRSVIAMLFLAALATAACSPSGVGSSNPNLRVLLTDAPIDLTGVTAVNVTIDEVTLYPNDASEGDEGAVPVDGGPISSPGGFTVNLLDFRDGNVTLLTTDAVPAGSYQRIRLHVSSAELTRDDDGDPGTPDLVEPIFIPSEKVDVPLPLTLSVSETLEVTLDFDAGASVQVNSTGGQHPYILRPVITPAGTRAGSPI